MSASDSTGKNMFPELQRQRIVMVDYRLDAEINTLQINVSSMFKSTLTFVLVFVCAEAVTSEQLVGLVFILEMD